jgi:hypothetical protein
MDFNEYLVDRFDHHKPPYKMNQNEERYFKKLNDNMIAKSKIRILNIKTRIDKDIDMNNFNKKYQIKNLIEYHILQDYCDRPMKFINKKISVICCYFHKIKTQ